MTKLEEEAMYQAQIERRRMEEEQIFLEELERTSIEEMNIPVSFNKEEVTITDSMKTAQKLKEIIRLNNNWYNISTLQKESIDNILQFISKIISGEDDLIDNISGIKKYTNFMKGGN